MFWQPLELHDRAVTVLSAAALLFLVMDPFGNIPIFLSILERYSAPQRLRIFARELMIALAVLMLFLFAGQYILDALGISESSLTAAGGVILFLIALRMVFPKAGGVMEHDPNDDSEPLVVPLAIPLIAGPSAMASVMFIMSSDPLRAPIWAGAVFLALAPDRHGLDAGRALFAPPRAAGSDRHPAAYGHDTDCDCDQHDDDGDSGVPCALAAVKPSG